MKKEIKFYNMFFPIWLLYFIPVFWLIALPVNFIIDLLVIIITMKILKINNIKPKIKNCIFKTWIFGFIADIIGSIFILIPSYIATMSFPFSNWIDENIVTSTNMNPFSNFFGFIYVTLGIFISFLFIYFFNYKICLKKLELEIIQKKKISLSLAIFTAPYTFLIPTIWLYS